MNAVRCVEPGNLAHHGFGFAGFDVGDVHVDTAFELRQLVAECGRAQVAADAGELVFVVAESGFDDQVGHFAASQAPPQRRVGPGVAGEHPPTRRRLGFNCKAHRRHGVRGFHHLDPAVVEVDDLADCKWPQFEHRRVGAGQAGEVGPDHPVEDVGAQGRQGFRQRVHGDRLAAEQRAGAHDAVGQQRDGQHVVEVRVADEDVVDPRHLVEREVAHAGAGIDEQAVAQQERGGLATGGDGPGAAQHADDHLVSKV